MTKHDSDDANPQAAKQTGLGRRAFIGTAGALAVGSAMTAGLKSAALKAQDALEAPPAAGPTSQASHRANWNVVARNYQVRVARAKANAAEGLPHHPDNGDEDLYPDRIGSDTRGLPHDAHGYVDPAAYNALLHAVELRTPEAFELVPLGGTRKLQNPLGALAVNLSGVATTQRRIPVAPELASAERAADAVEAYWQALLRDVPFSELRNDTNNELVLAAASELDKLPGYTGPRDEQGRVTPAVLFRGTARYGDPDDSTGRKIRHVTPPGVLGGPYLSQFLLRDIPYGAHYIPGQLRAPLAGTQNDFLLNYDEWLAIQDGRPVTNKLSFDPKRRYITTGRDLAEYTRAGGPTYWGALQLLSSAVSKDALVIGGLEAPTTPTNPYLKLKKTSAGTSTWGTPYIQSLLPFATSRGQRATYFQKWFVHRTIRPEAFGGLAHNQLALGIESPLHTDFLHSEALDRSFKKYGVYLLPLGTPEGAPNHGSYPGGAALNTDVNTTLLKAFYGEDTVITDPVQPDPEDPSRLIPYVGPPLTIGGELNKLATNIGLGRNWLGVHWRSDAAVSLPHAEEIAFGILRDERPTFVESFDGFKVSRYDGTIISI
ncbi:MAG: hypothetical protein RL701_583 [Pseudomonadota bacterium]